MANGKKNGKDAPMTFKTGKPEVTPVKEPLKVESSDITAFNSAANTLMADIGCGQVAWNLGVEAKKIARISHTSTGS
jgi:hypothetical protein